MSAITGISANHPLFHPSKSLNQVNTLLDKLMRAALLILTLASFCVVGLIITGVLTFSSSWVVPVLLTTAISTGATSLFFFVLTNELSKVASQSHSSLRSSTQLSPANPLPKTAQSDQPNTKSTPEAATAITSPAEKALAEKAKENQPPIRTSTHVEKSPAPCIATISPVVMPKNPLTDFYLGISPASPTNKGCKPFKHAEFQANYFTSDLPTGKYYLQWTFPVKEVPNELVGIAPVLDDATIAAFREFPFLRQQMIANLNTALDPYGLKVDPVKLVVQDENPAKKDTRAAIFVNKIKLPKVDSCKDHFARMIQIMKSLQLLGLECYSVAIFKLLDPKFQEKLSKVPSGLVGPIKADWEALAKSLPLS